MRSVVRASAVDSSRGGSAWTWCVLAAGAAAGACSLPDFAPEDRPCPCVLGYVCNPASNRCELAAATSTTGGGGAPAATQSATTVTSSAQSATVVVATSTTSGGGGEPDATPLEVTEAANLFAYDVAGKFRLEGDAASHYQLARWVDYGSDPNGLQSAMARVFYEALWVERSQDDWIGLANAGQVSVTAFQMYDESPVRGSVVAELNVANLLNVTTTQTVYASGRIAVSFAATTVNNAPVSFANSETHHLSLVESAAWAFSRPDPSSFSFRRVLGPIPSVALLVNHEAQESVGQDFASNAFFFRDELLVEPNDKLTYAGEIQIGIAGATDGDVAARASDIETSQIITRSDTSAAGTGYDQARAVHVATALGPVVEVGASTDVPRFAPAFEVHDWESDTWVIRRGDVVEASSQDPIGPRVLARYDATTRTLLFLCLDTLPAGAPDDVRYFRIETQ